MCFAVKSSWKTSGPSEHCRPILSVKRQCTDIQQEPEAWVIPIPKFDDAYMTFDTKQTLKFLLSFSCFPPDNTHGGMKPILLKPSPAILLFYQIPVEISHNFQMLAISSKEHLYRFLNCSDFIALTKIFIDDRRCWYMVQYHQNLLERDFPLVYRESYATCLYDGTFLSRSDIEAGRFPSFDSWETFGEDMFVTAHLLKFWKGGKPRALHPSIHTTPKAFNKDPLDILDYEAVKYFVDGTQHLYLDRSFQIMKMNFIPESDEYDCGLPALVAFGDYLSCTRQTELAKLLHDFDVEFSMCQHAHHEELRRKACAAAIDGISYGLVKFGPRKLCASLIFRIITVILHVSLILTNYGDYMPSTVESRYHLYLVHRLCCFVPWVKDKYNLELELIYRLLTRRCFSNTWICDPQNFYWKESGDKVNKLRFLHCAFELLCTALVCTIPMETSTRPSHLLPFSSLNSSLQYLIIPSDVDALKFVQDMGISTSSQCAWILYKSHSQVLCCVSDKVSRTYMEDFEFIEISVL